ncbi:MAG: copper-binding protein [Minicystis sp.]
MHARLLVLLLAGAVPGIASAACSRPSGPSAADAAAVTTRSAKGTIKGIDADKKTILIAHEDIPGYMKAMTMQFNLRDAGVARGLATGDKVSFDFTDDGQGNLVVQSIQKTP